ncbi:MAG TPA: TonB-dependent receptor [Longimicrobiales bacterium]
MTPASAARSALAALAALAALGARPASAQLPPVRLDSIHVTVGSRVSAGLPVATRAVEVLTAEAIARTPARTVADVLAWALGVDVQGRSPAQADVAIRGASFEQVLVLVDGVRMSDAQTGHFDLDLAVPLSEVERIEILRGPATALYGADAVGGVIHIVTRRAAPSLTANVDGGSFGTAGGAVGAGFRAGSVGARVAAEARRSDGHRPGTDYETVHARAALDIAAAGRTLRADVAFAARDFGARAFYTPPAADFDEYEETRTATATLAWLAPADAAFAIEPRLSVRRHEDDFVLLRDDPAFYRNRHTGTQLGGEVVARWAATPALRFVLGGEAYTDRLESTSLGDRHEERAALFAEAAVGAVDGAAASLGLRGDWHSTYGAFVAPSIAGALPLSPRLRLRGSVGRAFRAPTWTDRYYRDPANVGTPELRPERAWEAEIGADLEAAPGVRLRATAFLRDAEALIDWARPTGAPVDAPWRTLNVASATFRGLEVAVEHASLLGARWNLSGSVIGFDSEAQDGLVSKYALRPLTRTVQLAAERAWLGDALWLTARVYHARRAGTDEPAVQDGACVAGAAQDHTRADARLAYEWRGARVFLDLRNLTDTEFCDVSGVMAPGRAAYLGVAWRLGR